jgi:hypothetical protein
MATVDSRACPDALRKAAFVDALAWSEEETEELLVGGESNRVVRRPSSALSRSYSADT